jgi:hypothetical protein
MPISLMTLNEEIKPLLNNPTSNPELVTELSAKLLALTRIFWPKKNHIEVLWEKW